MNVIELVVELSAKIKQLERDHELLKWQLEKSEDENKKLKESINND